jgi:hypothetical protein
MWARRVRQVRRVQRVRRELRARWVRQVQQVLQALKVNKDRKERPVLRDRSAQQGQQVQRDLMAKLCYLTLGRSTKVRL